MPDPLLCANPGHGERKAVATVSFPDAQFTQTAACRGCATWQVRTALSLGHPVLVEPIKAEGSHG